MTGTHRLSAARGGFDHVRAVHERTRLFCAVLDALADDLFQVGREAMALSLSDYANGELSELLRWERAELLSACSRLCPCDAVVRLHYDTFVQRHSAVADTLPRVANGLDLIASGATPRPPLKFILDILEFTESVKLHLDWQDGKFLPHIAQKLPLADLVRLDGGLMSPDQRKAQSIDAARDRTDG